MENAMTSITAMSTICADVFDNTEEIRLGGEALNFAMAISGYPHIEISLMGAVGNDIIGKKAIECIKRKNINRTCVHIIEGGKTATHKIYHDLNGDRYFKEDSWDGGVYQDFRLSGTDREKLRTANLVFINYYSPNLMEILELKSKYGYQAAVDFDVVRNFDELEKIVSRIEFIFFSGDENMLPTLKRWSELYHGIFNTTLAEKGSVSYCGGREYRVNAVPVQNIVDTTGCGDNYHAAFIASYFKYHDITAAMEAGSLQASRTLMHLGGFEV